MVTHMASDGARARYRALYARLLRLYPEPYRTHFGEGMEQTFNDLCRETQKSGGVLFAMAFWVFAETIAGILRERRAIMFKQNKRLIGIVFAIVVLLSIPLVAMQFTDEVDWSVGDFVVMGFLLFGTGLTYEYAARKAGNTAYRAAVGVALVTAFLLTWINLAVGIIGSEDNPANAFYVLVPFIGIIGAGIARFRPLGMSRALFVTAAAQALVPIIALIIWSPRVTADEGPGIVGVFVLNTIFVGLFILSGFLFRYAGEAHS